MSITLPPTGIKQTDDAERQIERLLLKAEPLAMVTLIIVQAANKLAHFGKEVRETWQETQRLRQALPGPTEE